MRGTRYYVAWDAKLKGRLWLLGSAYSPDLAVHPRGHALAVFRQPDGAGERVWFNRFTPALGWEVPAPVAHREADVAATPRIAIDSKGNAIAVWEEADGSGNKSLWGSWYAVPTSTWDTVIASPP